MAARDWEKLLAGAPTRAVANRLVRCVPQLTFQGGSPPSYLFTSGAVNRCNPAGVRTIYLSEDRETAHAEYASYYRDPEPELLYHADLQAAAYVDLGDASACRHFGFTNADFFGGFRLARGPTPLQSLGAAITAQTVVTAVRFPSNARHHAGKPGFNFAIFRDSLRAPDSLTIIGRAGAGLERWP